MSFRVAILGCVGLLWLQAAWMTLPEMFVRANWADRDSGSAEDTAKNRAAAEMAARLSVIRGDLWADFALTYSGLAWPLDRSIRQPATRRESEQAQATVKGALRSSPHDARLWLLLAALDVQIVGSDHQQNKETVDALKMAYYTAPNEVKLSPYRLMVAVRPGVLADQELQELVRNELRMLLTHKPQFNSAILAAYREASPAARSLVEDMVYGQDPDLLRSAQSATGVR